MNNSIEKKEKVKIIFDSISWRYDFLNHFLSAGIDFYWRKKALKLSRINADAKLLDVACGTGDFSIAAKKFNVSDIYGIDFSFNMLQLFQRKMPEIKGKITQSIAEALPFKNEIFTNILVAFGVRNFFDIPAAFNEFFRVLKPGGKVSILEFSLPRNALFKLFYLFYFRNILPFVGRIISRNREAYSYLPDSVSEFHQKINLVELLKIAGFKNIEVYSLTLGIVQLIIAEK